MLKMAEEEEEEEEEDVRAEIEFARKIFTENLRK